MTRLLRGHMCLLACFGIISCTSVASASVIYVNSAATGTGAGTSWQDACTTIQAGVNAAVSGDEVWVRKGTYAASANPAVAMKDGVALYGGFAGAESTRDARDVATNHTTISGNNSFRCVLGANNAVLDGFTIRDGVANEGAAMYNEGCINLVVAQCMFAGNAANAQSAGAFGGAIFNSLAVVTITYCSFVNNSALSGSGAAFGGALCNMDSPVVSCSHCTFAANSATSVSAGGYGGAIFNDQSTFTLDACVLENNEAGTGSLSGWGGGICFSNCSPSVTNCVFVGNVVDGLSFAWGGAIFNMGSTLARLSHCTFTANTALTMGGAMYNGPMSTPTLTNCILYNDTAAGSISEIFDDQDASSTVTYSCISTGYSGATNISSDPCFVDGTDGGDGYDLWLLGTSPCIDAGTDISATVPAAAADIVGVARPAGSGYDMGAYEHVAPVAAFSASVSSGAVPLAVTFTDASTTATAWPITAWAWDFGDGGTSTEQNPTYTFITTGLYVVSLTVTTSQGTDACTHTLLAEHGTAVVTAWPVAGAITYGQSLASSSLTGGASETAGAFAFPDTSIIPEAGLHYGTVLFIPTDLSSYGIVYANLAVTVAQGTPTVSPWPTAGGLTYGQALSASALSGGSASVDGAFAFARPDLKPAAGTYTAGVTFTPTDAANFASVSGTADVEIAKATPVITTLPAASAIVYGQRLSSSTLTGGQATVDSVAIAGAFAFTTPTDKPGSAGDYPAAITFTPADSSNYFSASGSVSVSVTAAECPDCVATTGPYTAGGTACLLVPGTFSSSATFIWMRQDNAALDAARCTGVYCQRLQITDLRLADAGTYQCTYTDGAASDVYTVTIAVTEAQSVPAMPHGWALIAVVLGFGLTAAWRCRRSLFA